MCITPFYLRVNFYERPSKGVFGAWLIRWSVKTGKFQNILEPISFLLLGHGANFSNHGTSSSLLGHLQDCSWSTDQRWSHFHCRPSTHCIDGKYKNSKAFANFRNFALKAQYKRSVFGVDYEQLRLFMNIIKRNLVQKAIDCVAGSL